MFGAGWTEMLIIGVVALVVIGPKDLPVVMAKLGRMVKTVRRMGDEFRRELDKTTGLDQITELRRSITEPLRQTSDEIMREFNRQTATGVEPSGIVKPTDPNVESVYDQIAATSGLPPQTASAEALPAPAEAAPARPRRSRKPKAAAAGVPAVSPARPKRGSAPKAPSRTSRKAATPTEPAPAPVEATPDATAARPAKAGRVSTPSRKRSVAGKAAKPSGKAVNGAAANGGAMNGTADKPKRPARAKAAAKPAEPAARPLPVEEA